MGKYDQKSTKLKTYADLTGAASKGFNSSTYQRTEPAPSFEKFRSIARATRKTWVEEKKHVDNEIKKISETFLPSAANPRITELRNSYGERRSEATAKLHRLLEGICESKRTALDEYMMRPPKSDTLNLLTAYNMRSGEINSRELQALLTRCGSNYQSLQIAKDITERSGYTFQMPIDIETYISDLDMIETTLGAMVDDCIDRDDGNLPYNGRMFFNYEDDCVLVVKNMGYSLNENDTITESLTGVVPTIGDSMKAAIELKKAEIAAAKEEHDLPTAKQAAKDLNAVSNYYDKHQDTLLTEEERRENARSEAQELLDGVMD